MKIVLVIEDEPAYQQILKDKLEEEQFEVVVASSAKQSFEIIEKKRPDIILLDIMLPGGLNGFDILEQLKTKPQTKDIPVIVITNISSEENVAKEIGATYYFVKSETTIEQIINCVKRLKSHSH